MWGWLRFILGRKTPPKTTPMPDSPTKYKNITFEGSTFPDDPYRTVQVNLNSTIRNEYLPMLNAMDLPKGLKLLITAMTHIEGFRPGTRSYKHNNPGNIGNTDNGANKGFKTLVEGIQAQAKFIQDIAAGKKAAYPIGKPVVLKPSFSQEIQNNLKTYNAKSGYIPGYRFKFTGQLSAFVKIYATLPRINNTYVNVIVSYFKQNGVEIGPESKLADIVAMG